MPQIARRPHPARIPEGMRHSRPLPIRALGVAAALACLAAPASATTVVYEIHANGAKEVTSTGTPSQGDLDGAANGSITLDNGTGSGTTGSATFSLVLSNIDLTTLSGHHIHIGSATTTGSVVLNFGDPDTIRSGSILSGTITGLSATQITTIFSNPTNFYYNLHNGPFPGGAVRDQLPEPGSFALLAMGAMALAGRRVRRP